MKKTLLLSLALVFATLFAQAQFHLGAKVGANFSKINGQDFKDGFELGYVLGGFAEIDFSKTFGIQPEVVFNQTNTKVSDNPNDALGWKPGDKVNLNYLTVPVLLRINASPLLTFHVGPQFGILLNNHKTTLQNVGDAFKGGDFAMALGAQLNLKMLRVFGRYNIGLSDIGDLPDQSSWKSQQIQVGLGLKIL
ncbi:porin family protein [Danxiaibacter flavus]|uniref:Porin family protein n=1 Tax=Danxiaibacter flavus TaxID=3049108 RepID=A0ABV3ZCL2_9BACT|nr:porin family protein [Chitinophagaceae bacterium DXS]